MLLLFCSLLTSAFANTGFDASGAWSSLPSEQGPSPSAVPRGERAEPTSVAALTEVFGGVVPGAAPRLTPAGSSGEAGVVIRPLLPLDTVGVAFVNEAWARWTFAGPAYVEGRLSPIGLGWSQDGHPRTLAGGVTGGLDHRFVSLGLGVGWTDLHEDRSRYTYETPMTTGGGVLDPADEFEDGERALTVNHQARIGARDGLNLEMHSTILLVPEYVYNADDCALDYGYIPGCSPRERTGSAFTLGSIALRGAVPVSDRVALILDGGIGWTGPTWITGGASTWLRGEGEAGSVGLEVSAGFGEVVGTEDQSDAPLYGPLLSAGARWRFGRSG